MSNLNEIITFNCESAYDLQMKQNFQTPNYILAVVT